MSLITIVDSVKVKPAYLNVSLREEMLREAVEFKLVGKIVKPHGYVKSVTEIEPLSNIVEWHEDGLIIRCKIVVRAESPDTIRTATFAASALLATGVFVDVEHCHILIIGGTLTAKGYYVWPCGCFVAKRGDPVRAESMHHRLKKVGPYKYIYACVAKHVCIVDV